MNATNNEAAVDRGSCESCFASFRYRYQSCMEFYEAAENALRQVTPS